MTDMDIDIRLPFRVGTSKLLPLPANWVAHHSPFCSKLSEMVDSILSKYLEPGYFDMWPIRRLRETRKTLLILSSYNENDRHKWHEAICELHKFFYDIREEWVAEITDYTAHTPHVPKVITTAVVDPSADILRKVTALVNGHEWVTMDILDWFSPVQKERRPTVVITAQDAHVDLWWTTTIPIVEQLLQQFGLSLVLLSSLDQLSPGTFDSTEDFDLNDCIADKMSLDTHVGDSCGLDGIKSNGSLGFRVLLNDGRQFGVTSCQSFKQAMNEPGSTQATIVGSVVQSPSHEDYLQALEIYKRRKVDIWTNSVSSRNRNMGRVSAVSSSESWLTDWCLFESRLEPYDSVTSEWDWQKREMAWTRITPGRAYQVKKRGRTTGVTNGTINPLTSVINPKYTAHFQDATSLMSAYCIVPKYYVFALPGDFGASIQESNSQTILGLCVAFNNATKVTYMSPMDIVMDGINAVADIAGNIKEPKETSID
ncbi:hypothetical protein EJ04DRAFT_589853 [Polyplosphaeria fusca]|uniref:Uncharacterized protein n=1 Tax=Polyplosphaeria fusca TaxID=682080 RepID=A0A9P4QQK0_9PLEO|nr:hypothetical protein EJ04DRAFT_589853 [Polyplosphaeria fusca]